MARLEMWFSAQGGLSLERTVFRHPLLENELRAVRGKTAGVYRGYNTFQWTPAVQALCTLILKTAILRNDQSPALLEGFAGSIASSLDFCLGKLPQWLMDMFGVDSNGNALARRMIVRSNPERKRSGPVAVAINAHTLSWREISIHIEEQPILEVRRLANLVQEIEAIFHARGSEKSAAIKNFPSRDSFKTRKSMPKVSSAEFSCPCCGTLLALQALSRKIA